MAIKVAVKFVLKASHRIDIGKQVLGLATRDEHLVLGWLSDSDVRLKVGRRELMQFSRFMRGNDLVAKNISQTAVLMVQGEQDRLVRPTGTVKLFDELATTDKSMLLVNQGEHLIFEEGQFNDGILNSVSKWLDRHTSQTSVVAMR